jgi:hypothetical protein
MKTRSQLLLGTRDYIDQLQARERTLRVELAFAEQMEREIGMVLSERGLVPPPGPGMVSGVELARMEREVEGLLWKRGGGRR